MNTTIRHPDPLQLREELENFREITWALTPSPGELPCIPGLSIVGVSLPLADVIGGDHAIYVDFKTRFDLEARIQRARASGAHGVAEKLAVNRRRAGFLLADVAGHRVTDAVVAAMLHQAFLMGCSYELDVHGEITTGLFEKLKTRFSQSSAGNKYFTMMYGEVWDDGRFRFITAGQHPPFRFSPESGRLGHVEWSPRSTLTPMGLFGLARDIDQRSSPVLLMDEQFTVQESRPLLPGEMLILTTDGLVEHADGTFLTEQVPELGTAHMSRPLGELAEAIRAGIMDAAPPEDDITYILIRREPEARSD